MNIRRDVLNVLFKLLVLLVVLPRNYFLRNLKVLCYQMAYMYPEKKSILLDKIIKLPAFTRKTMRITKNQTPLHLYGLSKIRKENVAFKPIVDMKRFPTTFQLKKYLSNVLTKFTVKTSS